MYCRSFFSYVGIRPRSVFLTQFLALIFVTNTCIGLGYTDWNIKSRGEVGVDSRIFWEDDNAVTEDQNVGSRARLYFDAKNKPFRFRARLTAFYDVIDEERSTAFAEEFYLEFKKSRFRLRAGYQMLNWTATEAFHPADVMNSRYLDSNVQNADKLGEPMLALRLKFLNGAVEGYFMPFFIPPILSTPVSRQSFAPGILLGRDLALARNGKFVYNHYSPQWALKLDQTISGADVSIHVLEHIDREAPLIVISPKTGLPRPLYQTVMQVGGTYQQVLGPVVAKTEIAYRWFKDRKGGISKFGSLPNRNHGLVAAGLEYLVAHEGGSESTFLVEGQAFIVLQDNVSTQLKPLFEEDILFGYRYSVNDTAGTVLFASVLFDIHQPEQLLGTLAYERRLGDVWGLQSGVRLFFYPSDTSVPIGFSALDGSHQLYLNFKRYF